jgi:hypothetical protein
MTTRYVASAVQLSELSLGALESAARGRRGGADARGRLCITRMAGGNGIAWMAVSGTAMTLFWCLGFGMQDPYVMA